MLVLLLIFIIIKDFFVKCAKRLKPRSDCFFSIKTQNCIITIIIIIIVYQLQYACVHYFAILHKNSINSINTEHRKSASSLAAREFRNAGSRNENAKIFSKKKTCINIPESIHFPTLCLRFKMDFYHQKLFFCEMNFQLF